MTHLRQDALKKISLRIAHLDDAETVHALLKGCESETNFIPYSVEDIRTEIEKTLSEVYVIEDEGTAIGAAICLLKTEDLAHIEEIGICESHRGKGIGGHVLGSLLTDLKQSGCKIAELDTHPENKALDLYQRMGFRHLGRIQNFKGSGTERIRLQRFL